MLSKRGHRAVLNVSFLPTLIVIPFLNNSEIKPKLSSYVAMVPQISQNSIPPTIGEEQAVKPDEMFEALVSIYVFVLAVPSVTQGSLSLLDGFT